MAEAYGMTNPTPQGDTLPTGGERIVFRGSARNMVVGLTLILAGAAAFVMGMTDVFFAEAMAWTFIIWGALFLFADLIDYTSSWTITPDALEIDSTLRFWQRRKVWDWANINRFDLLVKRNDPKAEDVEMQVYFTPPGDTVLEREDRVFSPQLARLILERSGLKSTHTYNPASLDDLPAEKAQYVWNRSGKMVQSG
jgi:hypothetical protein